MFLVRWWKDVGSVLQYRQILRDFAGQDISLRIEGAIWLDFQNFQPKGRLFKSEFFAGGLHSQTIFSFKKCYQAM